MAQSRQHECDRELAGESAVETERGVDAHEAFSAARNSVQSESRIHLCPYLGKVPGATGAGG